MAAASERKCTICFSVIKNRSYRMLDSETSRNQWGLIYDQLSIQLIGCVCNFCTNKLNRIRRLTDESNTKAQALLSERDRIVAELKELPGVKEKNASTPKVSKKRSIHEAVTPNSVTPKSKKKLFLTPQKSGAARFAASKKVLSEKGTQTKTNCQDIDVKVSVKYRQQERTYIVSNKLEQKLVKVLINKGSESAFCKHLSKCPRYKSAMKEQVIQGIKHEVDQIVKNREDLLRVNSIDSLLGFDWRSIIKALDKKVPTLMSVLRGVISGKKQQYLPHLVTAASIMLYARNQTLNLVQFVLGLILDSSGLNKEGLNIVHDIGLSVSHTSVYNKRKGLIKKQEENIDKFVRSYVRKQVQNKLSSDITGGVPMVSVVESDVCVQTAPAEHSSVEVESMPAVQSYDEVERVPAEHSSVEVESMPAVQPYDAVEKVPAEHSSVEIKSMPAVQSNDEVERVPAEHSSVEIESMPAVQSNDGVERVPAVESCVEGYSGSNKSIEVLGDNLDITVSPAKMSIDCQRKSLHWFLTMVKQRQVIFEEAVTGSDTAMQPDVMDLFSCYWVPDKAQIADLHKDMQFHVAHVLLKYVEPLNNLKSSYPKHIPHPYMEFTKQKSVILNCDLIDASENSSQGMIEILQSVHNLAVPHIDGKVVNKVVFGGDVLTNERAFNAQPAMQNNLTEINKLTGVTHRPEGLHRQFNLLLVIY